MSIGREDCVCMPGIRLGSTSPGSCGKNRAGAEHISEFLWGIFDVYKQHSFLAYFSGTGKGAGTNGETAILAVF